MTRLQLLFAGIFTLSVLLVINFVLLMNPLKDPFIPKNRSQKFTEVCGMNLELKEGLKVKLNPLLSQEQAEKVPEAAFADGVAYYNQNEDVFSVYYEEAYENTSTERQIFEIACENRTYGKEYIADGWGVISARERLIRNYNSLDLHKIIGWDIFKDPQFMMKVTNLRGVVAVTEKPQPFGDYSNTFYLRFEFNGKKFRFEGTINPDQDIKFGGKDLNILL